MLLFCTLYMYGAMTYYSNSARLTKGQLALVAESTILTASRIMDKR